MPLDKQTRGAMMGNQYLKWLLQMMSFVGKEEIKTPVGFHAQTKAVKSLVNQDSTGMVSSVLDFAVNAANVQISIETSNAGLTAILNRWLNKINLKMKGVETGIRGLADQYYKERWEGSSFLVLKTEWEKFDGLVLPTSMYFLDPLSIQHEPNSDGSITIGNPSYNFKPSKNSKVTPLLDSPTVKYFYQNPYGMWGDPYSVPFIIRRGIYYNSEFLNTIKSRGASVIKRAIEHMMLLKKGFKEAAMSANSDFIYNRDELEKVDKKLHEINEEKKYSDDMATYTTNFDTEIDHIIPEYKKILNGDVIVPAEKGLLASLGFIELYNTSTRKEAVLNPKPFIEEVKDGVNDFCSLINEVILNIVEVNSENHRKYTNVEPIKVNKAPIDAFIDGEIRTLLRSLFDRGKISSKTLVEVGVGCDYDIELQRKKQEEANGDNKIMCPAPVQVADLFLTEKTSEQLPVKKQDDDIPDDKLGPETRNYITSELETSVYNKNSELPDTVKVLPKKAQTVWRSTFNAVYKKDNNEEKAIKIAWSTVKKLYKKVKDKWVEKANEEREEELVALSTDDLLKLKREEIMSKQEKLIDKILKDNDNETV